MFIAKLKYLSFKKNIHDLDSLLTDQAATYAVLRYAHDIPSSTFNTALEFLVENMEQITDARLLEFVDGYVKASGIGIEFTDEFDHTLELEINMTEPFGECEVNYGIEVDDNDSFNFEYDAD